MKKKIICHIFTTIALIFIIAASVMEAAMKLSLFNHFVGW